jgi:hypothetical protein
MTDEPATAPETPAEDPPQGNGSEGWEYGDPFTLGVDEALAIQQTQTELKRAQANANQVLLSILRRHGGDETWHLHFVNQEKRIVRLRRKVPGATPHAAPALYQPSRAERRAIERKLRRR